MTVAELSDLVAASERAPDRLLSILGCDLAIPGRSSEKKGWADPSPILTFLQLYGAVGVRAAAAQSTFLDLKGVMEE